MDLVNLIDVAGTLQSDPLQGFAVTRWTGTGTDLAIEQQDSYSTKFIAYDSLWRWAIERATALSSRSITMNRSMS